ncbi:MAG: lamin tail domain-containing protein [Candidatus Pristimantibacillus sp.]
MAAKRWKYCLSFLLTAVMLGGALLPIGYAAADASGAQSSDIPPTLLITELVPDSTNVGDEDAYEYIEVYNNTDQPINFGDYMIVYRYPGVPDDDLHWRPYTSVIIPPQQSLVLWGMTTADTPNRTVDEFNANYGTNLIENVNLIRIPSGMNDLRERTIAIATSTGQDIVTASYNKGVVDTKSDMGIIYTIPDTGTLEMKLLSSKVVRGTPGSLDPGQAPAQPVSIQTDFVAPTVQNRTSTAAPDLNHPIEFIAEANDDRLLTSVLLHYKKAQDQVYKSSHIARGKDGLFRHSLDFTEWYGSTKIDYFFRVSDGTNVTETSYAELSLQGEQNTLTLNLKDGDVISGEKVVVASGNGISPNDLTLSIEGAGMKMGLAGIAYFTFEANGINAGQNAITVDGDIVQIIPHNTTGYVTVQIPVSPDLFKYGQINTITVQAGSINRPYYEEFPETVDLDDYNIRNVRLILADGTVLRDPQYTSATNFDMGDDGRFLPIVNFNYDIPESGWVETSGMEKAMDKPSYFVFEANGISNGKNYVTVGREELSMIPLGTTNYTTIAVPIRPELFRSTSPNRIAIRAGSVSKAYYEHAPEGGLDDFDIRNVRLVLADGTELRDPKYASPTLNFDMGDNGRFLPIVYFEFAIPEDKWNAVSYHWDTTEAADGPRQVTLSSADGQSATANVIVDNNGPVITSNMTEGQSYKGNFTISAEANDAGSAISSFVVTLDGAAIQVPYSASSAVLDAGEHVLYMKAIDAAGQTMEKTVRFVTPEEHPDRPVPQAPANGTTDADTDTVLQVKVQDPAGDSMKVTFYQGKRISAGSEAVTAYANAVDREPPLTLVSPGDALLSEGEKAKLAASDNEYVTTDATLQFPYQRFEVEVGSDVGAGELIELYWEGHSLEGRKVSLYAWNYRSGEWKPLASMVARSEEDFTLAASVQAGEYVSDGRVQVLIQDLIPGRDDYDYTFVAMPDTQLYAEIIPEYFQAQVEWIRDNKEAMNIRYVAHVGDIVNFSANMDQWNRADKFMKVLEDADIPYGVVAGNHDVFDGGANSEPDYSAFSQYFGEARFKDKPFYGESYKDNRGHYDLISAGGNDYIVVYMGWGVYEEDMSWMNGVLQQHPDRKAILVFHEYMKANATRSATGEMIYNGVVIPNPNVVMVISGHYTGSSVKTDALDDNNDGTADRYVHQILNDYQGIEDGVTGGSGYLKLFHFDTETGQVYVNTYSPVLDDYNYYEPQKDEWTLNMDLVPQVKRVATDMLEVRIYSDKVIGSTVQAASGDTVEMTWSGLAGSQTYYWYAIAEDAFGGLKASELSSFRTRLVVPAPSGLQATDIDASGALVSWNPVLPSDSGAVAYRISVNGAEAATVTESVYAAGGLEADTEYRFKVTAVHESGVVSVPSEELVVRTLINLASLQAALDQLIASGGVLSPLTNQLSNSLIQAEHHKEKGHHEQAVKALEDFLKHLRNEALASSVSEDAKQLLEEKTQRLIQLWNGRQN